MLKTPENAKMSLEELFKDSWSDGEEVTVKKAKVFTSKGTKNALEVKISQMYEYPTIKNWEGGVISMLQSIAKACGGKDVNNENRHSSSGCETCDYGSNYVWEFVVW